MNMPHDSDSEPEVVIIPFPRNPPDNRPECLPGTGLDQPVWWYIQNRNRGDRRKYSGRINRISGPESERVRSELAEVIGELLEWAARRTGSQSDNAGEDGEAA
ncbi:hypothetical protein [Alloactinosynnema sp. L-07]|uniref:hypothetical protein n=1 Tax=Alloactinosynnema sp. L-07 TaxID=1653480 RepID=UPI0012FBD196|nr:hypothetical protein [Alloactinosynnema sp. L-07]